MQVTKKPMSVADILEREIGPAIEEWLKRVNLVSELADIPLSDADRIGHLPKVFHDLICRLRLANKADPPDTHAAAHGEMRYGQGYSIELLVEESRVFQVVTFHTLHLHLSELDHERVLLDVAVIADEVDSQLTQAVRGFRNVQILDKAV